MDLLAVMRDKTAGRHRDGAVLGIEFGAGADPPGALQHHDVAVVGVEMRVAEMIALGPFGVDHVEAGLVGITNHDRVLPATRVHRTPRNLVGQFEDDGRGIEFGCRANAQGGCEQNRDGEVAPEQKCASSCHCFHCFLPRGPAWNSRLPVRLCYPDALAPCKACGAGSRNVATGNCCTARLYLACADARFAAQTTKGGSRSCNAHRYLPSHFSPAPRPCNLPRSPQAKAAAGSRCSTPPTRVNGV